IVESARAAGLAGSLKRIEPAGERRHRVVFESAEFPDLMSWLASLTRERPFAVAEFSADRSGAGRVDATVVLETGGP
ncbi:MAG: type II secretion system protein GspM, partial [Wenzhouxiangellaceae bacterium]|nr:type II secretion system protein GspM [Wenzhouxiangellaceae bacterium]